MTDVVLPAATYERLRRLQAEAEVAEARAKYECARALSVYHEALRAAGVDPGMPYRWRDEDYTLLAPKGQGDHARATS